MSNLTRQQFIDKLAPLAIEDMRKTGVPASLTIAQGILESNNGNSTLAQKANNLFGMKGKGPAGSIRLPTREYKNGEWITLHTDFRKYHNWEESVADHSNLFINGVSWNRNLYRGVIGVDGITAAREVAKAGYATDPDYDKKLIKLITDHQLVKFDFIAKFGVDSGVVVQLMEIIEQLQERVKKLEESAKEIPAPEWFLKEFPNALDLLHDKKGTYDFWRSYAIILRVLKSYGFRVSEND